MSGDFTADIRLEHWGTWMRERQKVMAKIGEKVHRGPETLLMNTAEDINRVKEEKLALEYTKIPTEIDKYRGKPDFWKLPIALKPKNSELNSEYFVFKSKAERYEVSIIEQVGVANYVLNEKHVLNGTRNIFNRWQSGAYRRKRIAELNEKLVKIIPHRPSFQNLIIIGNKIPLESVEVEPAAQPAIAQSDSEKSIPVLIKEDLKKSDHVLPKMNFEVNGILLNETNCIGSSRKLRVDIEYDISSTALSLHDVIFKNKTCVALRFYWKKVEKHKLFQNHTRPRSESFGFFFDKNEMLILPGQIRQFPILFKFTTPGLHVETWELTTKPEIWMPGFKIVLTLACYAYYKDMREKVEELMEYIDTKARNLLIKDLLNEILDEVKYTETPVPPCVYEEEQLFEMANITNGQLHFLYDRNVVEELKLLYGRIKGVEEQTPWNYSIETFKKLAQQSDIVKYLDNKKIVLLPGETVEEKKVSKVKLASKKDEKKDKKSTKSDKKKNAKSMSSDKLGKTSSKSKTQIIPAETEDYIYSNQIDLNNIVRKLDSPTIWNRERLKYFICEKLISSYFQKMCILLNDLQNDFDLNLTSHYPQFINNFTPLAEMPNRKIYEHFEDYCVSNAIELDDFFDAKPRPKNVNEIPDDEIETLYRNYFNKSAIFKSPASKASKAKLDKKDKANKGKVKNDKKVEKNKTAAKIEQKESLPKFDPYAELFTYIPETEPAQNVSEISLIPEHLREDYDYKSYLIVYNCLGEAVDAIVDAVEALGCTVSYNTLAEVLTSCPEDK